MNLWERTLSRQPWFASESGESSPHSKFGVHYPSAFGPQLARQVLVFTSSFAYDSSILNSKRRVLHEVIARRTAEGINPTVHDCTHRQVAAGWRVLAFRYSTRGVLVDLSLVRLRRASTPNVLAGAVAGVRIALLARVSYIGIDSPSLAWRNEP